MISVRSTKERKRKMREVIEAWMNTPIRFPLVSSEDASDKPFIMEAEVEGYVVRRVNVDEGAAVEAMFEHCFKNLDPTIRERLKETHTDLVGFSGEVTKPLGKIELEDRIEDPEAYSFHHPLNDEISYAQWDRHSGQPVDHSFRMQKIGKEIDGATYQRLVDTAFQSHIGRNFKAYVGDMVIKRNDEKMLLTDIAKTFDNLRKINMKLNPKKYSFGVSKRANSWGTW
ncbi:hypothetical protein Tco_0145271 [Tanacetum coccineum]